MNLSVEFPKKIDKLQKKKPVDEFENQFSSDDDSGSEINISDSEFQDDDETDDEDYDYKDDSDSESIISQTDSQSSRQSFCTIDIDDIIKPILNQNQLEEEEISD